MKLNFTRDEINAAIVKAGYLATKYCDVETVDLNALLTACSFRKRLMTHVFDPNIRPTLLEQATLFCLDEAVRQLCKTTGFADHEAMNVSAALL